MTWSLFGKDEPNAQRGVTLIITLVVLFAITAIVVYTGQVSVWEYRTSVNEYRAVQSTYAAEAAIETALARLSDGTERQRIINDITSTGQSTDSGTLDADADRTFSYTITSLDAPTHSVFAIEAVGCADHCGATCSTSCPAHRRVRQVAKVKSMLANGPRVPLTVRGNATLSGTMNVTNTEGIFVGANTEETTIRAGGSVGAANAAPRLTTGGGNYPPAGWTDPVVMFPDATVPSGENAFFESVFGTERGALSDLAVHVPCSGVCNTPIADATAESSLIWVDGDATLNANTQIGDSANPVILIIDGNLSLRGNAEIYGAVYVTAETWDNRGGGTGDVYGAAIAEGDFEANGTPNITYDRDLLNIAVDLKYAARIAGSWSD